MSLYVYFPANVLKDTECWIRTNAPNPEAFRHTFAGRYCLMAIMDNVIIRNTTLVLQSTRFILSEDLAFLELNSEFVDRIQLNKMIKTRTQSSLLSPDVAKAKLGAALFSDVLTNALQHTLPKRILATT